MVANGKAGMSIQVTGTLPGYVDAAQNPDQIGTFPFPATDKADDLEISQAVIAAKSALEKLREQVQNIE